MYYVVGAFIKVIQIEFKLLSIIVCGQNNRNYGLL